MTEKNRCPIQESLFKRLNKEILEKTVHLCVGHGYDYAMELPKVAVYLEESEIRKIRSQKVGRWNYYWGLCIETRNADKLKNYTLKNRW
jgi:hypothetical protein